MLVPYNTYRLTYHANPKEVLHDHHLNPDLLRWELHRVWVVEATLKPGEQHAYSRRVFYVDEDTWAAVASDEYGPDGQLLRTVFSLPSYNYVAGVPFTVNHVSYDFSTGNYFLPFLPGRTAAYGTSSRRRQRPGRPTRWPAPAYADSRRRTPYCIQSASNRSRARTRGC